MQNEQEQIFLNRMADLIGIDESNDLLSALKHFPAKTVRYNQNLVCAENLVGEMVPWCAPFGRIWHKDYAPSADLAYLAGHFYIQEKSAMLAVSLAAANIDFKGKKILDLCAAPGGKSTQAAELAKNGLVVANEVIKSRIDPLVWNTVRHRLTNMVITSEDSANLAENLTDYFDIVIVDAPCSGEGLFQKKKNSLEEWSEKNVLFCANRQKTILQNAAKCLKNGGYLVYSTCTFAREENEDQISLLLKNGFRPVDLHTDFGVSAAITDDEAVKLCSRRIFPHREGGSGAFAAIVQKNADLHDDLFYEEIIGAKELAAKHDLLPAILPEAAYFYTKNQVVSRLDFSAIPNYLFNRGRQIGLPILNLQKYTDPMQGIISLASPQLFLEIDANSADKFARGEDLRFESPIGWYFVTHNKMILGYAKVAAGRVINKLPNPLLKKSIQNHQ